MTTRLEEMTTGDDRVFELYVAQPAPNEAEPLDLTGHEIHVRIWRGEFEIVKTLADGIELKTDGTDGTALVTLDAADTVAIESRRDLFVEAWTIDGDGKKHTVVVDTKLRVFEHGRV